MESTEKTVVKYFALWPSDDNGDMDQDQVATATLYSDGTMEVSVLPGMKFVWNDETHLTMGDSSTEAVQ